MKINSVSTINSFGLKIPEGFAQKILDNCEGISLSSAEKLTEKLKAVGSDTFSLISLSSSCKKPSLFGQKLAKIRVEYEKLSEQGEISKCLYGDIVERKTPFSADEIFQMIKNLVNHV